MKKIAIGIYGSNGHQIQKCLKGHPHANLIAISAFDPDNLPQTLQLDTIIKNYDGLDGLIKDPEVELVSLCSPRRDTQASDAIKCLRAGKHVYAEKPCALTVDELDQIIDVSKQTGMQFHEMAGTAFEQPYLEMSKLIAADAIGKVIQVFVQKSYPYADWRPQDEGVDGGLLAQVGIHAIRMIEQVAGTKIKSVYAEETQLGNPKEGELCMACSMTLQLENGGIASVIANYLNSPLFETWGNETLRIFGTKGFMEAVDGGTKTRLILNDKDLGKIEMTSPSKDYFDMFIDSLLCKAAMPLSIEDELHPTRIVIRAKAAIKHNRF